MENASTETRDNGLLWKLIGLAAALVAGFLVQKLIESLWTAAAGHKPPEPDDPGDSSIREVALAAALTGAASAVARGLAQRGTQRMALRAARTI